MGVRQQIRSLSCPHPTGSLSFNTIPSPLRECGQQAVLIAAGGTRWGIEPLQACHAGDFGARKMSEGSRFTPSNLTPQAMALVESVCTVLRRRCGRHELAFVHRHADAAPKHDSRWLLTSRGGGAVVACNLVPPGQCAGGKGLWLQLSSISAVPACLACAVCDMEKPRPRQALPERPSLPGTCGWSQGPERSAGGRAEDRGAASQGSGEHKVRGRAADDRRRAAGGRDGSAGAAGRAGDRQHGPAHPPSNPGGG